MQYVESQSSRGPSGAGEGDADPVVDFVHSTQRVIQSTARTLKQGQQQQKASANKHAVLLKEMAEMCRVAEEFRAEGRK